VRTEIIAIKQWAETVRRAEVKVLRTEGKEAMAKSRASGRSLLVKCRAGWKSGGFSKCLGKF
jgi:hypothetical protein